MAVHQRHMSGLWQAVLLDYKNQLELVILCGYGEATIYAWMKTFQCGLVAGEHTHSLSSLF